MGHYDEVELINPPIKEDIDRMKKLLRWIKEEAMSPLCSSYDFDPTPTAEERLKFIVKKINQSKIDLK
jgi:hypothetical protein